MCEAGWILRELLRSQACTEEYVIFSRYTIGVDPTQVYFFKIIGKQNDVVSTKVYVCPKAFEERTRAAQNRLFHITAGKETSEIIWHPSSAIRPINKT